MRYFLRALKYFLYFSLLTALILFVFAKLGFVESDINSMFRDGYNSLWKIIAVFAVISAVYPLVGYGRRTFPSEGGLPGSSEKLKAFFCAKGYVVETDEPELLTFRAKRTSDRIRRMWEDRISITGELPGICLEGSRKEIARLALELERALGGEQALED